MRTFVQILVLELDESQGDPGKWDWSDVIDTPGSVLAMESVEVNADPSKQDIACLTWLTNDYHNGLKSTIGVIR